MLYTCIELQKTEIPSRKLSVFSWLYQFNIFKLHLLRSILCKPCISSPSKNDRKIFRLYITYDNLYLQKKVLILFSFNYICKCIHRLIFILFDKCILPYFIKKIEKLSIHTGNFIYYYKTTVHYLKKIIKCNSPEL